MNFVATAAQVLPVLFLAVVFNLFGKGPAGSPFGTGLYWSASYRPYAKWFDAVFALLVNGMAFAGEALALSDTCPPAVAAALGLLGLLLTERYVYWGLAQVSIQWFKGHPDLVLIALYVSPIVSGLVCACLVAFA